MKQWLSHYHRNAIIDAKIILEEVFEQGSAGFCFFPVIWKVIEMEGSQWNQNMYQSRNNASLYHGRITSDLSVLSLKRIAMAHY